MASITLSGSDLWSKVDPKFLDGQIRWMAEYLERRNYSAADVVRTSLSEFFDSETRCIVFTIKVYTRDNVHQQRFSIDQDSMSL